MIRSASGMESRSRSPLLPVHSQRRQGRRGSCLMPFVLALVIVAVIGYTLYAKLHVGSSADRRAQRVQDMMNMATSARHKGATRGMQRPVVRGSSSKLAGTQLQQESTSAEDQLLMDSSTQHSSDDAMFSHQALHAQEVDQIGWKKLTEHTDGDGSTQADAGKGMDTYHNSPLLSPPTLTEAQTQTASNSTAATVAADVVAQAQSTASVLLSPALDSTLPVATATSHLGSPIVASSNLSAAPVQVAISVVSPSPAHAGDKVPLDQNKAAVAADTPLITMPPATATALQTAVSNATGNATAGAPGTAGAASGLYALIAVDISGKERSLSEFAGKITIVVNVASACGYTDSNYKGLMSTYEKYRKYGLEILGFPCNQFGAQEAGSEKEIKEFCTSKYHVTFPMFAKVEVNGADTHPVFQFLKTHLPAQEGGGGGLVGGKDLSWNFNKYLVNHLGQPVRYFDQAWDGPRVEQALYPLLQARLLSIGSSEVLPPAAT